MEVVRVATKYPLLEECLALRQMTLEPFFTVGAVAKLFAVSTRSIQTYVKSGQLTSRNLPGRGKFLPTDLEEFISRSTKRRTGGGE